jgi:tetratricopeptide (TPR) repeat protein
MNYEDLLQLTTLNDVSSAAALERFGTVIDLAHSRRDLAGTEHALTLAATVTIEDWPPTDRATFYYFLANAYTDLQRAEAKTRDDLWEWSSEHVEQSLLALRRASNEEGFTQLPVERRCQILTNLGNTLSGIGRFIEALEVWNEALKLDETFPMALANRAYGRFHYAKALYDEGHREAFLHHALTDFIPALDRVPYADARAYFTSIKNAIAKVLSPEAATKPHSFRTFPLGTTPEEIAYRTWCLQQRTYLNPINDLVTDSVAAHDVILTPTMTAPMGEPPIYQGFFNQLKQEYATARYLFYAGTHRHAPAYPDKQVLLLNTMDYPSYGTNTEFVKLAYRSLYSIFDKIAFFLNAYLKLGIKERAVNFQTLWHEKEKREKPLKEPFRKRPNLPLRGIYWISRDLDDKDDRHLQPDAALLSTVRQHLEHKYLKAHEPEWAIAEGDPLRTDTLAYNIARAALEEKTLRLLRITRAALIYLVLAIHVEEQQRRAQRGNKPIPGAQLDTYKHDWKS